MKTKTPVDRIVQKQRMFCRLVFPSMTQSRPLTAASARRYLRAVFPEARS